ncbi:MAG: hypothetical protein HUU16_01510 [Candidatus Omnitrophica bacterium]|nr:hypothetical protein [Candidatus Omnitrophota bacterium]
MYLILNPFPGRVRRWLALAPLLVNLGNLNAHSQTISHHEAVYDEHGTLLPWAPWTEILEKEMTWYLNCPVENGYPRFVFMTFMTGDYTKRPDRDDFIPSTQNGMGIISYLKYHAYTGKKNPKVLEFARAMGNYLCKEALTPDEGKYPRFTRSTGIAARFPQPPDCGTQADRPYEIQPDKGGIAGYALALLYKETRDELYLNQALQNARCLMNNMRVFNVSRSPWPFRADYRTGEARGEVTSNLAYILRLFDELIALGHTEFRPSLELALEYIEEYQIPNLSGEGSLWVQFFEDYELPDNRNAWAPLNLARYLLERREGVTDKWREYSLALIEFVNRNFTSISDGILVCGEQDGDKKPWGGVLSTYAAVLAMYSKATGDNRFKGLAREAMNYCLYAVDEDGCPGQLASERKRGGWQEDAHTDKIHNLLDALSAYPEWGNAAR